MSYNGSGTFQINTSGQPVVAGTVISSTAFNALTADLATGLSTAITKDGQTTATARIPFAAGINSSLATDSSSTSTGSIITAGGVGIVKNLNVGANANIAGTLGVTGVATFSAAPIYSSLTASSAVATDASKALISVTNTGTGNNVLATSPTITTPTIDTIKSAAATALTLQSAGTTALTLSTAQNATFAGTVADSTAILRPLVSGTAVATTSGTSVDFTGIPSWVKRITFVYSGVSSNGVSSFLIQIGPSSAVETSGYLSTGNTTGSGGTVVVSSTAGFIIYEDNPVYTVQGIATIVNVSSDNWVFAQTGRLTAGNTTYGGGDKTLASTLARLRFTTVNGTDSFDAGSINILYE